MGLCVLLIWGSCIQYLYYKWWYGIVEHSIYTTDLRRCYLCEYSTDATHVCERAM